MLPEAVTLIGLTQPSAGGRLGAPFASVHLEAEAANGVLYLDLPGGG